MLLDLVELAANKALEHDSQTRERLRKLQGKTMTLHIKTLERSLTLSPQIEGLEFSRNDFSNNTSSADGSSSNTSSADGSSLNTEPVDVTLKATIGAMLKISRDGMEDADLQAGELEMIGDPIVGQRFAQLIANLDIDWESLISEQIGSGPAKLVITAAEQLRNFTQESKSYFNEMTSNIMKDELNLVVDRAEVDEFLDDVDTLRGDVQRLFAKIKNLDKVS